MIVSCLSSAVAWEADATKPLVTLGQHDSGVDFHRIRSAVRLSDGRFVVSDEGKFRLRVFSSEGRLVALAGRQGRGPGEFVATPDLIRLRGDTVLAFDRGLQRGTVLDPRLNYVRHQQFPISFQLGSLHPIGPGDGWLWLAWRNPPSDHRAWGGTSRTTLLVYEIGRNGQSRNAIHELPGFETSGVGPASGVIFGKFTVLASDSSGFFVARNDSFSIERFSVGGELKRVLHLRLPTKRVTPSMRRQFLRESLARLEGRPSEARRRFEDAARQYTYAKALPPVERIFPAGSGVLWVMGFQAPGQDARVMYRFALNGLLTDVVTWNARWYPLMVWGDTALVVSRDTDDVQRLEVRVLRPLGERG